MNSSNRILVLPGAAGRRWLADAVRSGGGEPVTTGPARALVWADPSGAADLASALVEHEGIDWVQLPWAGIEPFVHVLDRRRRWTCGKGVYAEPVAEHALALALAGLRGLGTYAPATSWRGPQGRNLLGARTVVIGGGGIAASLARLLAPFHTELTVVRRSPEPFDGAASTVTPDRLDDVLPRADVVFLAVALTPETDGLFDARRLGMVPDHAWIVNVARGRHIVTDHLVAALDAGTIGGAALDVTDPEPLPERHPLWSRDNCIITPHVGNTPEMAVPLLSARVTENVRRYLVGEELIGAVDVDAGY